MQTSADQWKEGRKKIIAGKTADFKIIVFFSLWPGGDSRIGSLCPLDSIQAHFLNLQGVQHLSKIIIIQNLPARWSLHGFVISEHLSNGLSSWGSWTLPSKRCKMIRFLSESESYACVYTRMKKSWENEFILNLLMKNAYLKFVLDASQRLNWIYFYTWNAAKWQIKKLSKKESTVLTQHTFLQVLAGLQCETTQRYMMMIKRMIVVWFFRNFQTKIYNYV